MAELLEILSEHLADSLVEARWEQWQTIARLWGELNTLRYNPDSRLESDQLLLCKAQQERLDAAFHDWLCQRYAPLGSQRLPVPHHLYHVPHYLAYQRRQTEAERVALIILDSLSLEDWILIAPVWRTRHPDWRFQEILLLAQVPTVTAISRQALVSGLRPADLPNLHSNRSEPQLWANFWGREGLADGLCAYAHLNLEHTGMPPALESARVRALCLTDKKIDDMVHSTSLGATDFQASLRIWLDEYGRKLEGVIAGLLRRGFSVHLSSDHGHVEAHGIGQPSEGLTVYTRGKRARIYADRRAAAAVQEAFAETILWSQDGLLPEDLWVLMPQGRRAFAPIEEVFVTHGGTTLDEMVVPLVSIIVD